MKISRVVHAGYIFEKNETKIILDPIFENPFSQNCYAFPDVIFDIKKIKKLDFSAILISHIHDDHFSLLSLNLLSKKTPVYIYSTEKEAITLIKELGFKSVQRLEIDQEVIVGELKVIPRKALNSDVDSIFEIKTDEIKVLNVVDSWIDPSTIETLIKSAPWDLILWPFQVLREVEVLSPHTMNFEVAEWPFEWIDQIRKLNPRFIIPSSCQFRHEEWSWHNQRLFSFSYSDFFKIMKSQIPSTNSFKLNPGESIKIEKAKLVKENPLKWIETLGDKNEDYKYNPHYHIPSMAEIAQKFPKIELNQKMEIEKFINFEMLKIFSKIGPSQNLFFNKKRTWRLSVLNSTGIEQNFDFQLIEEELTPIENSNLYDWKTEISEFKLYQAVKNGEALTSLYLRVHNPTEVDALEDPLIRILYARDPLSFQKAQLQKIKV